MGKKNLSVEAYEHIKQMILHVEIKPGERIPEEKIAGQLGSSRTPIREALRKLSNEGLVYLYPKRFAEVAHYDQDSIREIGALRLSQDMLSAQLALHYGSNADFVYLRSLADKCEEGARIGNIYDRIRLDCEFHLGIAHIGGNQLLVKFQQELYQRIHLIQISKYSGIEDSLMQIQHHHAIVDALTARDFDKTKKIICNHLQNFFDIDRALINQYLKN
ncbi:MAG: GntR family transcriptional regulator [Clostridiales bacterium]|nr:GntR family transcriptional regulator [Clostridiales bacterium]